VIVDTYPRGRRSFVEFSRATAVDNERPVTVAYLQLTE